jgi:hypothetical protein
MAVMYTKTLTVSGANTTAIAALQAPTSGTALTLAATTTPNTGQRPTLTSTANLSAITFTFVGKDYNGLAMTFTLAGPNNNTVTASYSMSTITSITPNGTSVSTVSAGYAAAADLPAIPCDVRYNPTDISFAVHIVSGSPTYTARFTMENPNAVGYDSNPTWAPGSAVWWDHPIVSSQTTDNTGNYGKPCGATSLYATGACTITYTQIQGVGPN